MKGNEIIKKKTRALLAVMTLAIAVTFTLGLGTVDASAATKTPSKPSITSTSVELANITIKWSKAKNAQSYQVALRTSSKKWCYEKTVKGTKANKTKYTKAGKYKVVKIKKGKNKGKYKVYRYRTVYSYKTLKSKTTSRTYIYKTSNYNTSYTLAVRGVNTKGKTKKYGSWCAKSVKTESKDAPHVHKWKWIITSRDIKSGYACNGCYRDITEWDDMYDCCGGFHTHQWFIMPEYYICKICGARKHEHSWMYKKPTYVSGTDTIISEGYWVCYLCGNESSDGKTMEPLYISDKGFKSAAHYGWRTPYDFFEDSQENWILVDASWEKKEDVSALDNIRIEGNRSLSPGDSGKYKVTFTPSFATEKIKWKSTNPSVISVDKNGNYKALAVGTAKIIATTVDTNCEDYLFVRVTNPNIGIVKDAVMLINGERNPDSEIVLDGNGKRYQVTLETNPSRAVYYVDLHFEEDSNIVYLTSFTDSGNLSSYSWENNPTFPEPQMEFKANKTGTATIVATITDANFNKTEIRQRVRVQ